MSTVKTYENPKYTKFVSDMEEAGIEVRHYEGRGFYRGPAAEVSSVSEVTKATKIKCVWDNMGLDYVVYPK